MERIEFENGSAIESFDVKDCVHNKRAEEQTKKFQAIKLEVGTKVECREEMLKQIQNNPYVKENFKLNIKRLNRWWYSVYFDKN